MTSICKDIANYFKDSIENLFYSMSKTVNSLLFDSSVAEVDLFGFLCLAVITVVIVISLLNFIVSSIRLQQ